ncbi:MAG: hypothetical protein EXX96DRAFT_553002 [Benjaminiella poitrasii]|nr:MAG: hypothetical protein EXX96DRAFT_553002 [Benjaminiella poitrasii]
MSIEAASNNSSSSSINSYSNEDISLPSVIRWKQTPRTITLHISIVGVLITERFLKLSNKFSTITLPLYNSVYINQYDTDQMAQYTDNTLILNLEKESFSIWPHLLMQQTDQEVENYLIEANFPVTICYTSDYDILDFDMVINGQGEKTGLE